MTRIAAVVVAAAILLAFGVMHSGRTVRADSTTVCPVTSTSSATNVRMCADTYNQLRQRLSGDLAAALTTEHQLSQTVSAASARAQLLSAELMNEEAKIAQLQAQVDQLDQQISDLQTRIDKERAQAKALARALYRTPTSFLDILASSGNLAEALKASADMVVAGQRAHALQQKLTVDLATAQSDRDARQADLDQENATLEQVQSGVSDLADVQSQLNDLTTQLSALTARIQTAAAGLSNVSPDVTAELATLMESQQASLSGEEQTAAWAVAGAGAGLATNLMELPAGFGPRGLALSWPMLGGALTQPFGPTSLGLEPPLGQYAHFHTGIDIAAPYGSPVMAAADGLVVSVQHTSVGYGNYVIIAHGGGLLTLYGHLADTAVVEGQQVVRGQVIGHEGSSGLATGPHVHFEVRVGGAVVDPLAYLPPR